MVAITGGAGSGATTLLDALSGLRPPTSGTVVRPAGAANGRQPAGHGPATPVGYVGADDPLPPVLPLARALRYAAGLRAVPGGDGAVAAALAAAGLTASGDVQVGALRPGERRRAAVAAALLSRPRELFLDQPTAGLDPAQAAEVLRLLRRLSDRGVTVLLTTSSPLDAARCDKVAVLACGGHLAFFGTPAGALGYFGADSLEEIYERLAGLGDPATAWSRRFFHFSRTGAGFALVPTSPLAPGPAYLVPDSAGPHSAGRVTAAARGDTGPMALAPAAGADRPAPGGAHGAAPGGQPISGGLLRPARQLPVLIRRNADVLRRSPAARAVLAAAPAAVLLAFAVLIGAGAFDAAGAGAALPVLGGFGIGVAYGLLQVRGEAGVLRAERFGGLSAAAYVAARLAVMLPLLAAADAIALVVPAAWGRLPHGYGLAYPTMLLGSAVALALATACVRAGHGAAPGGPGGRRAVAAGPAAGRRAAHAARPPGRGRLAGAGGPGRRARGRGGGHHRLAGSRPPARRAECHDSTRAGPAPDRLPGPRGLNMAEERTVAALLADFPAPGRGHARVRLPG